MTIRTIDSSKCETCPLRLGPGCPVIESCPTDVLRGDAQGRPHIAYHEDCHSCLLCQWDCPYRAVEVSHEIPLPPFAFI